MTLSPQMTALTVHIIGLPGRKQDEQVKLMVKHHRLIDSSIFFSSALLQRVDIIERFIYYWNMEWIASACAPYYSCRIAWATVFCRLGMPGTKHRGTMIGRTSGLRKPTDRLWSFPTHWLVHLIKNYPNILSSGDEDLLHYLSSFDIRLLLRSASITVVSPNHLPAMGPVNTTSLDLLITSSQNCEFYYSDNYILRVLQ